MRTFVFLTNSHGFRRGRAPTLSVLSLFCRVSYWLFMDGSPLWLERFSYVFFLR